MMSTITVPVASEVVPLADLFKPKRTDQSLENVLAIPGRKGREHTDLVPALQSFLTPPSPRKAMLARLPQSSQPKTFTLDEVEGALTNMLHTLDVERVGTITLTLPFGMDHHVVNAATFKALAGREGDTLLRQAGERWEIVEDDEPIDLGDRTQLFKLGRVQIYS